MRHLIGVVLAMVMTGALFFAGAWGYLRLIARTSPLSRLPGAAAPSSRITACLPR